MSERLTLEQARELEHYINTSPEASALGMSAMVANGSEWDSFSVIVHEPHGHWGGLDMVLAEGARWFAACTVEDAEHMRSGVEQSFYTAIDRYYLAWVDETGEQHVVAFLNESEAAQAEHDLKAHHGEAIAFVSTEGLGGAEAFIIAEYNGLSEDGFINPPKDFSVKG